MNYIRKNIIFVILCTICFTSCDNWANHPSRPFVINAHVLLWNGVFADHTQVMSQLYNFNAKGKVWTVDQSNNNSLVEYDSKVDYYRNWDGVHNSPEITLQMNEPAPDAKWALTFELRGLDCFWVAPLYNGNANVKPTYKFDRTYDSYRSDVYISCDDYKLDEAEPCD